MPAYATPEPINATFKLVAGELKIVATDRGDTVVEVRPANAASNADVKAARETTIDFSNGRLVVKSPKSYSMFGRAGVVDVLLELPAGSSVECESATGDVRADGLLGDVRFRTAHGDIRLDRTGAVDINTTSGDVTVEQAAGTVKIAGCGAIRVGSVDGAAHVKNISGDTWLGKVTGDVQANAANGDIVVARADSNVTAKTAYGAVRAQDVVRGSVVLETAAGELEIGVREGTSAWLDVNTVVGSVRSSLSASNAPVATDETVEVRARTYAGDVLIHRS
jgi:DUF4097 and DUF4098 domain-containing protein YvlB